MKKSIFLIALTVIGLTVISAQQPVPLPPTPTYVQPDINPGNTRLNLNQNQLQQLFIIRDQKKYNEYLLNIGNITQNEFYSREENLIAQENEILLPLYNSLGDLDFQRGLIFTDGDLREAIGKIWWSTYPPGYPSQAIRECLGFALQQPQGTRSTAFNERNQRIRISLSTSSPEQILNNIKQQFESGFGATMTHEAAQNRYTYVLRSNRSASGKPYSIQIAQRSYGVYIEISELRNDP